MSAPSIQPTFPVFSGTDGLPLENGYIWIGAANLDPQGNPITVYWDDALTIAAPQPIRTLNGYASRSGTPANIYVNSDYSIRVQDSKGSAVYSNLFVSAFVTTEMLADGAVTTPKIADGAVTTIKIADLSVTTGKLADNSVTTAKIVDLNVTTAKLAANAVTTAKITDLNVTTGKLADNAVTTIKITDANVTTAKIADANITAAKLNGAQSGSAPIYGARAWVNFNGTSTVAIRASGNVSSITDNGTGDYTVNFSTAMSDADYAPNISVSGASATYNTPMILESVAPTASAFRFINMFDSNYSGVPEARDPVYVNVAVFR